MKPKDIPCKEPQDCGWTCNEGHLCDNCKCELKIRKALKEQAEQFHEYLIKHNLPVYKDFFKIKERK